MGVGVRLYSILHSPLQALYIVGRNAQGTGGQDTRRPAPPPRHVHIEHNSAPTTCTWSKCADQAPELSRTWSGPFFSCMDGKHRIVMQCTCYLSAGNKDQCYCLACARACAHTQTHTHTLMTPNIIYISIYNEYHIHGARVAIYMFWWIERMCF